ncbi:MAG: TerD family protein [Anaerotignaceae bacterium]
MSVSLQKGQKISLSKENAGLSTVLIALGWDEAKKPAKGFSIFGGSKGADIDCDASVLLLNNGKLAGKDDIVYFGNLQHSSGAIQHMGDNLTGGGDGDDEQIVVDLKKIPEKYDRLVFVVNIYQAIKRNQHFGMIENAFIRIVDKNGNNEICRYNLTENYSDMYAVIFGEVYKNNGEWKFNAMGQGTKDPGLGELANKFK